MAVGGYVQPPSSDQPSLARGRRPDLVTTPKAFLHNIVPGTSEQCTSSQPTHAGDRTPGKVRWKGGERQHGDCHPHTGRFLSTQQRHNTTSMEDPVPTMASSTIGAPTTHGHGDQTPTATVHPPGGPEDVVAGRAFQITTRGIAAPPAETKNTRQIPQARIAALPATNIYDKLCRHKNKKALPHCPRSQAGLRGLFSPQEGGPQEGSPSPQKRTEQKKAAHHTQPT